MDFQNTFGSEGGKRVLLALKDRAKSEVVMTPLDNIGRIDICEVMSFNGKRSMITYIDSILAKDPHKIKQTEARSKE